MAHRRKRKTTHEFNRLSVKIDTKYRLNPPFIFLIKEKTFTLEKQDTTLRKNRIRRP